MLGPPRPFSKRQSQAARVSAEARATAGRMGLSRLQRKGKARAPGRARSRRPRPGIAVLFREPASQLARPGGGASGRRAGVAAGNLRARRGEQAVKTLPFSLRRAAWNFCTVHGKVADHTSHWRAPHTRRPSLVTSVLSVNAGRAVQGAVRLHQQAPSARACVVLSERIPM